ncbi:isoleucine-tRNA ligase [Cryptococcus neoformans C23]|uniref:isoleucine--tRNA ligase n=1 Tax=Cryptococcus neoformans (strain H99 / ATCC 208821 / CBS 10515 / FGSC 9487) TaxID=235443 RepID=J9W3B6_CRYN9|nr:isoleucine-tRNA ligase [Cryptococcus neoformans var. grubii H99]AUB28856.1 isoleucine-tRNA ligase [Cryptococcus neoformans var. grubii]OWZ27006.1 isoleucine-tRNA ligase [Cryptococcus neoformans var. grubii AD2-60a]OWZ38867.1 isoleucine-tRNA ligase [Cryptococcus neoformans var. grubii C23]OWZ50340.1 isoleucine-tRNA ligase [Cryptococcus neoformans var. grubii 125.91]OXC81264.1 isoleucine-tRNA ligase [Cryptococcus neoformans var. grubii AD1-7a]|eukprot:XP_012053334.1 isoleucine-tRNA ligase [Cryptococcus neoformans var. grubii H99]
MPSFIRPPTFLPRFNACRRFATPASSSTGILQARFATTKANDPAQSKKKAYSHTLKLPKTAFPLKHKDVVAAEKRYRSKTCDELYRQQYDESPDPLFVLHDGPPYANGHLHMGHALNKVIKDIINRYNVIRGRRVHYIPGWDCHGLPIEQKALAAIGKLHTSLTPDQVRAQARQVALDAIDIQKTEMRALGVMADWDSEKRTYRTLDHDFEIRQLRLFQAMVQKGFVTHRLRPVYYSPSSRTALAEAELEYKDGHRSRSVYVSLPVQEDDMSDALKEIYDSVKEQDGRDLSLVIWTTTPWSLPGNSGVAVHNDMEYVVTSNGQGRLFVLASERKEAMEKLMGPLKVVGELKGSQLVGTQYNHIFHPPSSPLPKPIVFAAGHVTSQTGTGLVHSAPAHGYEDYVAFNEAGIMLEKLRCPIDDDGKFTEELVSWAGAGDESVSSLVGKEVLGKGTDAMVDLLRERGVLLAEETIEHRYPYDWKSKKPIIIRATPQWFADVEHIKEDALAALEEVYFHPAQARKRLEAFVLSRSEWCISRQRSWGVPIPALFDSAGQPLMTPDVLEHVISVLDAKGVDYWWTGPVEEFVPPVHKGQQITKGFDTLDVWFDSGSSWTMLREANLRPRSFPLADVYLEGSDQHRGWFQSSLLTKIIGTDDRKAPYGTVITHGFVMDEEGEKMSKSAGNGLSPMEIIHGLEDSPAYGADVLRLWAASVDYTSDASIGPSSISHVNELLRRLRNTTRFLLANTSGQDKIFLEPSSLRIIDRYVLHELASLEVLVQEAYDGYNFSKAVHSISTFATSTLSTLYFDIIKDTLYCDPSNSTARNNVVGVLQHVLLRLVQMMAPIVPHLGEELYENMDGPKKSSVFLETWKPDQSWVDDYLKAEMETLLAIKPEVMKLVEEARSAKHIKTSSQAELFLQAQAGTPLDELLKRNSDMLSSLLGVSRVVLEKCSNDQAKPLSWSCNADTEIGSSRLSLALLPASHHQCPRCWLYTAEAEDRLCSRCSQVIT